MFIFCPVRDQLPKHYKDNLLRAKIKYVLFVYKALGGGMARGELRSTLSRAGPCRCRRSRISRQKLEKEKNKFSFSLGFHYISRLAAANIGCASEE